jgi:hypothetical protein
MHLFGFASDLERVELLFTSLLVQAAHGLAGAAVPAGAHPAAFRRTWLAGFAHVVAERLRTAEAGAVAGSGTPSVALVLADRSDRVQRRLAEVYPRLRTAPSRRLAGTGFGSGAEAGRRAELGGPGVTGGVAARRGIGR